LEEKKKREGKKVYETVRPTHRKEGGNQEKKTRFVKTAIQGRGKASFEISNP